jgi:hypothetical protein
MLLRYLGSPFSLFMLGLRLGDWRPQLNIRSTSYVRNCLESPELEGLVESDLAAGSIRSAGNLVAEGRGLVVITGISWCLGAPRNDDRHKDGPNLVTQIRASYLAIMQFSNQSYSEGLPAFDTSVLAERSCRSQCLPKKLNGRTRQVKSSFPYKLRKNVSLLLRHHPQFLLSLAVKPNPQEPRALVSVCALNMQPY